MLISGDKVVLTSQAGNPEWRRTRRTKCRIAQFFSISGPNAGLYNWDSIYATSWPTKNIVQALQTELMIIFKKIAIVIRFGIYLKIDRHQKFRNIDLVSRKMSELMSFLLSEVFSCER